MKWPLLLLLFALPLVVLSLKGSAYTITIISTPPINPPAYSYFYLEFQFSPVNGTPQPYAIFVGPSPDNLTMVAEGYTLPNGTGYARVPVINSQVEYVDVVWVNVNYTMFQIFPVTVQTNTTTTVKIYNNQGFSFSIPPWVSYIIGAITMLVMMGLGWKLMGKAGLAIMGVVGVLLTSWLGLIPSYILYIFVFIVAVVGARIIVSQFGGGGEEE